MKTHKTWSLFSVPMRILSLTLFVIGIFLSACGPSVTPTPTIVETVTPTVATTVATTVPIIKEYKSKDPTTFVTASISEPDLLDPALDYEKAGEEVIQNVYETLVFYKKESATEFVDLLAESHTISYDGKVYTFKIRSDIKFHEGQTLTPSDVAYSLQRALLQGGSMTPSRLLTEPILGIGIVDPSQLVDPTGALIDNPAGIQKANIKVLKAACDNVQKAIMADDVAGTVTITLAQAYTPFLATLSHTVSSIMSKEWVISKGGWDGTCATWQNFYGITVVNDPFAEIANGTGPYQLISWDHATKTVTLKAFDGYWRVDTLWEGAHTGPANVKNIIIKTVNEWGDRFNMLQAGDADFAVVESSNFNQVDPLVGERVDYDIAANKFGDIKSTSNPDGPLRLWYGIPGLVRTDIFMDESINIPKQGLGFIGSGMLSSDGIPADFFSDVHIRKAFNYCMDWDSYIKDYWQGEAVHLPYVLSLPGELGYDANAPTYAYDLKKCEEEFKAAGLKDAMGNGVWDTGFFLIAVYDSGNSANETILNILSTDLKKVNTKFDMEVLGIPSSFNQKFKDDNEIPIFVIGWQEDIHDPHNWYEMYLLGKYGSRLGFPVDMIVTLKDSVNRGMVEIDPAKRDAIYKELNQKVYDYCPYILGVLPIGRHYEQRWIIGYYDNPLYGGLYYYELTKK